MTQTWRYFDYDYDNGCIIMSDESDEQKGFIAPANEISLECESDLRYPVNLNQPPISTVMPSVGSHQSNISNHSYQSEVIIPSPLRKSKQKSKLSKPKSNPKANTPKKIIQKQKQIIPQMPVHHYSPPSNEAILMHPKPQNHIENHIHNHHHHQIPHQQQPMVPNQRLIPPQPGSEEYAQYLYNYHYHYYQGLLDFQRSLRK